MSPTEPYLPEHMIEGMNLYLEHGVKPGSFMTAILCNDLREAVGRADHINIKYITNIVAHCYNYIPSHSWGSPEAVQAWVESFQGGKSES